MLDPPESESIIIGRVQLPQIGTPAVLNGCDDEMPCGILVGSCLVNMEDKVPVRVQNKSVRLLKGTHLGKLTEATTEIKQVGNGEEKDGKILGGRYSVNSYTDISSDFVDHFWKILKRYDIYAMPKSYRITLQI